MLILGLAKFLVLILSQHAGAVSRPLDLEESQGRYYEKSAKKNLNTELFGVRSEAQRLFFCGPRP